MALRILKIYLFGLVFLSLQTAFWENITLAHVELTQPAGGEVLNGNSDFTIQWTIDESVAPNENWDIRFSPNNGLNWKIIATNLKSTTRQFNWRVPNINTTQAIIEVIEDRPSGADDGVRSGRFTIVKTRRGK